LENEKVIENILWTVLFIICFYLFIIILPVLISTLLIIGVPFFLLILIKTRLKLLIFSHFLFTGGTILFFFKTNLYSISNIFINFLSLFYNKLFLPGFLRKFFGIVIFHGLEVQIIWSPLLLFIAGILSLYLSELQLKNDFENKENDFKKEIFKLNESIKNIKQDHLIEIKRIKNNYKYNYNFEVNP
jgi:hypothetical protein